MNRWRLKLAGAPPVRGRHVEWSAISSQDDQRGRPSKDLLELGLSSARRAGEIDLAEVAIRCEGHQRDWLLQWPGEHYRLLAALGEVVGHGSMVEIGTFTGMGSLSLLSHSEGRLVTYDIVPWDALPGTTLRADDFGGRLEQRLGDLAEPAYFHSQAETLRGASLVFIDGPKDGVFEPALMRSLMPLMAGSGAVLLLDDIRTLSMLQLWRDIPIPKVDMTSFGHWSGTGLARFE